MFEDFLYALNNFRRSKTRTFLSLLGIIIGVASVIVITSMGSASTKKVENTFGTAGLDVVSISSGFMRRRRDSVTLTFDESFREDLFAQIEGIEKVWYKNNLSTTLTYGETSSTINTSAIEYGYLEMYGMELESGSFFSVTDDEEGMQKIILSHDTAESFFPAGDAVGKKIILVAGNVSFGFEIVGVLADQTTGMENGSAYIPRGFYSKKNPAKSCSCKCNGTGSFKPKSQ